MLAELKLHIRDEYKQNRAVNARLRLHIVGAPYPGISIKSSFPTDNTCSGIHFAAFTTTVGTYRRRRKYGTSSELHSLTGLTNQVLGLFDFTAITHTNQSYNRINQT